MSLLKGKYTRPEPETFAHVNIVELLEREQGILLNELDAIQAYKEREPELRNRLAVVNNSLQAFLSLEYRPEPVSEPELQTQRSIRKAVKTKTVKPTESSIAKSEPVSDTVIVKDEFSVFPE